MEDFFTEQTYYEFPSFEVAIFAMLLSFILSTIIAFTYRFTCRGVHYSKDFFQAIVLIAIIAATIMMSIGDSLARGLGILGALAIIRFRFRFVNPKNIVFIFASLAIGISAGVYGFAIALAGTSIFSGVAFILFFSPFGKTDYFDVNLSFNLKDKVQIAQVESMILSYCHAFKLVALREEKGMEKYEYRLQLRSDADFKSLFREINGIENISDVRFNSRGSVDQV
ncbi:MAG: DUF4956 domain-containing protein [Cyclobacteriaceae bacterium]|nr:DUF4956 domain-containing protein [Cyclobacteriaceae bacterium]